MADRPAGELWGGDGWIDVSRPLEPSTPVWPGDRPFTIETREIEGLLVSAVTTTCHVGTHVDAPLHLGRSGIAAHEIPIGRLIGPAEVVRLPAGCTAARPADLPLGWRPTDPKVLFRSDSHPVGAPIGNGFAALSAELVGWLADCGVVTVGIDTPSVDEFESTTLDAHRALDRRGMTWVEGLRLDGVEAGRYLAVMLPMPIRASEAAPLRALIRRLPEV